MAWCPVCKNEYRPGIKVCADCGAELVESLENNDLETLVYGEQDLLLRIKSFLEANGIKYVYVEYVPERELYQLQVPHNDMEKSVEMVRFFMTKHMEEQQQRMQEEAARGNISPEQLKQFQEQMNAQKNQQTAKRKAPKLYESSAHKAEENRASAWALLIIGFVTLVLIICCVTGVFKLPNFFNGSYMFFGVMGLLSVIFIITGFLSMKKAKSLDADVESENNLKDSLKTWCEENLKAEEIDHYIEMRAPGMDEATKFFPRIELIKARINHQFLNLDQGFLDQFVDEVVYEMIFPDNGMQAEEEI